MTYMYGSNLNIDIMNIIIIMNNFEIELASISWYSRVDFVSCNLDSWVPFCFSCSVYWKIAAGIETTSRQS